jgi:hypothetical protein
MPAGGPPPAFLKGFATIGAICGGAIYAAPPIFILIWLSRAKVKAEIATWGARVL